MLEIRKINQQLNISSPKFSLEIRLSCSEDWPRLCLVSDDVSSLPPLPGELVSLGAPADLSGVGGGQDDGDELQQSQHHANTNVGQQHWLHLHLHLLPENLDTAV